MTQKNTLLKNTVSATAGLIMALTLGACESTAEARSETNAEPASTTGAMNTPQMAGALGTLIINVSGYETQAGQIMVAVYNDAAAFDDEAAPLRDAKVAINAAETIVRFEGLPAGDYAFKIFHDENNNGELDTNGFGLPSEAYGFSMDASDPFSAPEFEESKFILKSGENTRNVSLD